MAIELHVLTSPIPITWTGELPMCSPGKASTWILRRDVLAIKSSISN